MKVNRKRNRWIGRLKKSPTVPEISGLLLNIYR